MVRRFLSRILLLWLSLSFPLTDLYAQASNSHKPLTAPRYSLNPSKVQLSVIKETFGPPLPLPASIAALTPSFLTVNSRGEVYMRTIPLLKDHRGSVIGRNQRGDLIIYSVDPALHALSKKLVQQANAPHVAVVAMDPKTGRILAMAEKSASLSHPLLHSEFPAASLFKVVTAAAALETGLVAPTSKIYYRGGIYQLNQNNYTVSPRYDKNFMQLDLALGKSCNPVFGRVALKYLKPARLRSYARQFGFDTDLAFDIPLSDSHAVIPNDNYGLSRTAAGFGDVTISPIHAATLMSAVANNGQMTRPYVVEKVISKDSVLRYAAKPKQLGQVARPETARKLMQMMETTTLQGTARNDFTYKGRRLLPNIRVAAKTGTLRGKNPIGLNRWFIAAAPIENPKIAVAVLAINPVNTAARPAQIGKKLIEQYLNKK
ncbi:MAG: penicillin-binding transpeptidase domain-containing protein [Bdellovibrionota bacterium]